MTSKREKEDVTRDANRHPAGVDTTLGGHALTHEGRRLDGLMSLIETCTEVPDGERIIGALLRQLPSLIEADFIAVVKRDSDQIWTWSNGKGWSRRDGAPSQWPPDGVASNDAAWGEKKGKPSRRLAAGRGLSLVPSGGLFVEGHKPARSAYRVKLTAGPEEVGLLFVERGEDHPFVEQEKRFIEAVAGLLSLVLTPTSRSSPIQTREWTGDPLTGLLDRRALETLLHRELKTWFRYGVPASLFLLDLDYFKIVNERLGYGGGDELLKHVAILLKETAREVDYVATYGGGSFAILSPHTDLRNGLALAERIRDKIERHAFVLNEGQVRITVSIGVTSVDASIESMEQWIAATDWALTQAKSRGRNCVATGGSSPFVPAQIALALAA